LGGEVDGIGQRIVGSPLFRKGGEVLVFILNVMKSGFFKVAGLAAGKVSVEDTAMGRQAVRRLEGLEQYSSSAQGGGQIQVIDKEELGSADSFVKRIRKAISSEMEQ
jgi:hypothetical protein